MIGALVTAVAGSSDYYLGGAVTYADPAKVALLGIEPAALDRHGAVSAETACAMAAEIRGRLGATVAVSVTGIAGPGGGSAARPVGLVYIAVATADGVRAERFDFPGDRAAVRAAAAERALERVMAAVG